MPETLDARQLIQLAQSLTKFQSAITDYEIRHYSALDDSARETIETALSLLATAAGRLYAYSVQLVFEDVEEQLIQLRAAAEGLSKFLKTANKIEQVLDLVSSVIALAGSVISHDIEGITVGINQIIQLVGNY
jgi:hypothetical protein